MTEHVQTVQRDDVDQHCWSPVFGDDKLHTFEHPEELQVYPETFAKTVITTRRVLKRNVDIWGAPFGDWVEIVVKAAENTTAKEYARQIAKDNEWTRALRESWWIGQQQEFKINEVKRCDVQITIRWKEGQEVPKISRETTKISYGKPVRVPGLRVHKAERRGGREEYNNENGAWVG